MKPFNLERALAGDPVVTRDGRKVLELYLFNIDVDYPLCGIIDGENGITTWAENGLLLIDKEAIYAKDLFMGTKKKKLFIGISLNESLNFGHHATTVSYESLEKLKQIITSYNQNDNWIIKEIEIDE